MTLIKKTVPFGPRDLVLETGEIARQASGAVLTSLGDTVVLATVVGSKSPSPGRDFFPLTVDYVEKTYAAGKIPGGFFKREGRPTEKETLTSRLIDRPLRPLFPDGFPQRSAGDRHRALLSIRRSTPTFRRSSAPPPRSRCRACPSTVRSGRRGSATSAGSSSSTRPSSRPAASDLDLVVAGTKNAVLMVESEAKVLGESVMLDAVMFGHEQMQAAIGAIEALAAEAGKPRWEWAAPPADEALVEAVRSNAESGIREAYRTVDKIERRARVGEVRNAAVGSLAGEEEGRWPEAAVRGAFEKLEKSIVRGSILTGEKRIDGRDPAVVRDIASRVKLLPRTHGSALFTRGETQAIVATTLGTTRDAQIVDAIEGERREPFMLHYNFPPFCVGETGGCSGPGAGRSATGGWRSGRSRRSCRTWTTSPTWCGWCPRSPSRTDRARWPRYAARAFR